MYYYILQNAPSIGRIQQFQAEQNVPVSEIHSTDRRPY